MYREAAGLSTKLGSANTMDFNNRAHSRGASGQLKIGHATSGLPNLSSIDVDGI